MRNVLLAGVVTGSLLATLAAAMVLSPAQSHAASTKSSANTALVHAGQDVFSQRCMQCHSIVEGQAMMGPSLYHESKKPHGSSTEIRAILKNGKGKMPSFKDRLTPEDTNGLVAYLRTL